MYTVYARSFLQTVVFYDVSITYIFAHFLILFPINGNCSWRLTVYLCCKQITTYWDASFSINNFSLDKNLLRV